jgi:ABC-type phosphate/phosphonate transport system substrate-binding protein
MYREETLMTDPTLIFTTFLAPAWYKFALSMVEYVERSVHIPSIFLHEGMPDDFATGNADVGFMDVLSYLQLLEPRSVEIIAAPITQNGSEDDLFSSFFDIVVREESSLHVPDDLEGCAWAYHSGLSHVEDDFLYQQGIPALNFSETIETTSPAQALRYVLDGKADATSIDARTFDMVLQNSPCMAARLRVLGSGCHAPLPLVVVASHLDSGVRQKIQKAFLNVHQESLFSQWLHDGGIERFVPTINSRYQEVHALYACAPHKTIALPLKERSVEMAVPHRSQAVAHYK